MMHIITITVWYSFEAKGHDLPIRSKLLSPYFSKKCCFIPKSWQQRIDFSDTENEVFKFCLFKCLFKVGNKILSH